ncbi:hypothetical protein [Breoghania sp.]|uniref:hypothetical protein n=1 Tax=Breoghania sp. TaxID=2065378 RepID=UPI00262845DE|nr:hypothetical protein [Breoghania sp.]MDJ0931967.1 hypothetical protein [Breoghania sp.]
MFSDMALNDPDGNIVYTYQKGEDSARVFDDPALAGTVMQVALTSLMDAVTAKSIKVGDMYFSGFRISSGQIVSAVVAMPVFYLDTFFGAVAFMVDMSRIAAIVNDVTGIGEIERAMLVTPEGDVVVL